VLTKIAAGPRSAPRASIEAFQMASLDPLGKVNTAPEFINSLAVVRRDISARTVSARSERSQTFAVEDTRAPGDCVVDVLGMLVIDQRSIFPGTLARSRHRARSKRRHMRLRIYLALSKGEAPAEQSQQPL